jgi:hypothetical protein
MEENQLQRKKKQRYVFSVSLIILILFMIMSAIIALTDMCTADNIRGMLGLNFTVTHEMIYGIIIIGGIILFIIQYLCQYLIFINAEKRILTTAST